MHRASPDPDQDSLAVMPMVALGANGLRQVRMFPQHNIGHRARVAERRISP
jgi:hypothetical protein